MPSRVIVLAGPSGSGKSRLSARLGRPVLNLDDFYRDHDDPGLPCLELAGGTRIVDWDSPASWLATEAVAAIRELCATGSADVPVYDISRSRRTGTRRVDLDGAAYFIAEGIFAQEIVGQCRDAGLLADAVCLSQPPLLTFVRRLLRDLREHRKPPTVLVRRGIVLLRSHRAVVAHAVRQGCRALGPERAYAEISELTGRR